MNLSVNVAAMSDVVDYDRPRSVVDLVEDAVISRTDSPAFTAGKFLAANGSGIFMEGFDFIFDCDHFLTWQVVDFFSSARKNENSVGHFAGCVSPEEECGFDGASPNVLRSNGTGVSPAASASSNARISSSSSSCSCSFLYSSMLMTTAIFSPSLLVMNWTGSVMASPATSFYSPSGRMWRSFEEQGRRIIEPLRQNSSTRDYSSSPVEVTFRTARNASCGMSTWPTRFMRFLPSFCFSRSLRLREMSPP
jgi:hypothetical protein